MTKDEDEITKLRELLVGVEWNDFVGGKVVIKNRIPFHARYGVFLNRVVVVVLANGKFVVVKEVPQTRLTSPVRKRELTIDPSNLESGARLNNVPEHLAHCGITKVIDDKR